MTPEDKRFWACSLAVGCVVATAFVALMSVKDCGTRPAEQTVETEAVEAVDVIRDYDLRVFTITEPQAEPEFDVAHRSQAPAIEHSVTDELEFICGPMQALEQGVGSVRRCEWVKKTEP